MFIEIDIERPRARCEPPLQLIDLLIEQCCLHIFVMCLVMSLLAFSITIIASSREEHEAPTAHLETFPANDIIRQPSLAFFQVFGLELFDITSDCSIGIIAIQCISPAPTSEAFC